MLSAGVFAIRGFADPEPSNPADPQGTAQQAASQGPAPAAVVDEVLQIGYPDALRAIDLYLDFLDPNSAVLVQTFGEDIQQQIEARKLVVNVRLVSSLDPYSASGSYSSRALIAAFLVTGESGTEQVSWKFIRRLFDPDVQPHQEGLDLTDKKLAAIAHDVGAPDSAVDFIAAGDDHANVDSHQIHLRNMAKLTYLGVRSTPLATFNGRPFAVDVDGKWLSALVSPSSSTATSDADTGGGATGMNVPHQEVTPGASITKPSQTLSPSQTTSADDQTATPAETPPSAEPGE
jgi:protein-disulfide isomerase